MLRFYPAEKTILMTAAAIGVSAVVLAQTKGIAVDYTLFIKPALAALVFVALGQMLRRTGQYERPALLTTLIGIFAFDALVFSTYNVMLLPRHMAPVDEMLVRIDAYLGYSWPEFATWVSRHPWLADALRAVYNKTLVFLLLGYCVLAVAGRRERLHMAAYTSLFASLITIGLWSAFPSAGASGFWTLDPAVDAIVRAPVNSEYGARLNALIVHGVHDMKELNVGGLIGFPSYHTVMIAVAAIAVWPFAWLRWIGAALLAVTIPSILLHGGHNLVDVLAGALITATSWAIATKVHAVQELRPLVWRQASQVETAAVVPAE